MTAELRVIVYILGRLAPFLFLSCGLWRLFLNDLQVRSRYIYFSGGATIDGHECSCSLVVVAAVAEVADKATRVFKRPFCLFFFFYPPPFHLVTHTTHPCGSLLFDSPVCLSVCLPRHYIRLKNRNNKQDAPPPKKKEVLSLTPQPKTGERMIRWLLAVGWRLSVVGDNRNNKKPGWWMSCKWTGKRSGLVKEWERKICVCVHERCSSSNSSSSIGGLICWRLLSLATTAAGQLPPCATAVVINDKTTGQHTHQLLLAAPSPQRQRNKNICCADTQMECRANRAREKTKRSTCFTSSFAARERKKERTTKSASYQLLGCFFFLSFKKEKKISHTVIMCLCPRLVWLEDFLEEKCDIVVTLKPYIRDGWGRAAQRNILIWKCIRGMSGLTW